MGFNTVALFLNDQSAVLDRRPDAVIKTLQNCMRGGMGEDHGPGQMQVLPSVHADGQQVVVAGGNRITSLGVCFGLSHDPEDILRQLAEGHGFRLVRKSRPAHAPQERTDA